VHQHIVQCAGRSADRPVVKGTDVLSEHEGLVEPAAPRGQEGPVGAASPGPGDRQELAAGIHRLKISLFDIMISGIIQFSLHGLVQNNFVLYSLMA
jgi:hypothetical protein